MGDWKFFVDMGFSELGVAKWLEEALSSMAIHSPSAIQRACIPPVLEGRDCIGGAKTGSGKTIAFAAPMLTQWSRDPYGICGLVLTPTRELALQIAEQFSALGATMDIRTAVVVGGVDMITQALELQRKPHFVIATPGRLADHIRSSGEEAIAGFRRVRYLVLDEADRLLNPGFADELGQCFSVLPDAKDRQTMLFTATVTPEVRALKDQPPKEGKKPVFIHEVAVDAVAIPSTLKQTYLFIPSTVKEAYLYNLLTCEENADKSVIVFANRTRTAETLRRMLQLLEVRTTSLHSEMPQNERMNALGRFRAEVARVLVATDVASRGLDIPVVEMVVNFDIPADADDYVHRVGRTARAGRKGESVALVSQSDISRIHNIEDRVGSKLEENTQISENTVIKHALKDATTARRQAIMEMDKENFGERKEKLKQKRLQRDNNSKPPKKTSKSK